jgi:transposase
MLSRTGHKALRNALYMPGLVTRRHNTALKACGDRLAVDRPRAQSSNRAVMRKLVHLIYGVIKSGRPFSMEIAMPKLPLQEGI